MINSTGHVRSTQGLMALLVGIGLSFGMALPARADDSLTQHVDSSEQVVREEAVIERGHVDLGPKIVDSKPEILARDDSGETPLWRPLDSLVFRVTDSGKLQVPSDPSYSFLHAREGESYWVIPQTQNPNVVWLGWNTQDPELIKVMGNGATMTLGISRVRVKHGSSFKTGLLEHRRSCTTLLLPLNPISGLKLILMFMRIGRFLPPVRMRSASAGVLVTATLRSV